MECLICLEQEGLTQMVLANLIFSHLAIVGVQDPMQLIQDMELVHLLMAVPTLDITIMLIVIKHLSSQDII